MTRHREVHQVILPTEVIIEEYEPTELLLQRADMSLMQLAGHVVDQWIHWEHGNGKMYSVVAMSFHELMFMFLHPDGSYLDNSAIDQPKRFDEKDRKDIELIIENFCSDVYHHVIPILESFHYSDRQRAQIHINGWSGKSLIVAVPD